MSRREAIDAFKARAVARGIFAVRCAPTGQAWVDLTMNLGAAKNGLWFAMRIGSHQAAWHAHGEQAFTFEVLATLPDDESPIAARDLLKTRKRAWMDELHARDAIQ